MDIMLKKLNGYIPTNKKGLAEETIDYKDKSFKNLRDSLLGVGKILEEDFDNNIYVLNVPSGLAGKNAAVVVVMLAENEIKLLGYAKEGLINQHTAEKAIDCIIGAICN